MLSKALAMSREQCNNLISSQNVLLAEQTQQLKNLERNNERLVNELRGDVWLLSKEVKESNNQLSKSLNQTLGKISETVTDIERQVSTATAKATDEAVRVMKQSINKMADNAVIAVNESAGKMINEVNKAKNEIEKAKKEIRWESGFRKFMFWLSPVLAVTQTVLLIMLAL
jgi:small-conductance mechanosensitive channel